jgi:hypothetical protein
VFSFVKGFFGKIPGDLEDLRNFFCPERKFSEELWAAGNVGGG